MLYYRLTEGFGKATMIPETDDVYKHVTKDKSWFLSPLLYNQDHYDQFQKTNSVAGITDATIKQVWWDIDVEKDLDKARSTTAIICTRLLETGIPQKALKIRFSGGKGFHVSLDLNTTLELREVRNIASGIASDLPGFDLKVYLTSQLLRLPLTKHKSGLYCIPITYDQLKDSDIKDLVANAENIDGIDPNYLKEYYKHIDLPEKLVILKDTTPVTPKTETPLLNFNIKELDFSSKPNFLDNARWALQNGYFCGSKSAAETGMDAERNPAFLCLAATYKNLGFTIDHTYRLLKGVAEIQSQRTNEDRFSDEELYKNIVKQVYSNTWKNGQYSVSDPDSWLYTYAKKYDIPTTEYSTEARVVNTDEGFDKFFNYAKNIKNNTMQFGIKEIDDKYRAQVGHLIGILAPPGIGKTSLALTILNNTSLDNIKSMLFSYDMHDSILFQKLVQRETGLDGEKIYEYIEGGNQEKIKEFRSVLKKNFNNVSFVFKSGQSISGIKKTIIERELQIGETIKLIVIDYSELVMSQFSDPTQASSEVIQGLREIANEMDKCVIVLLQPNKMNSKPNEPLLNYTCAKGSSSIAQAVTTMLTAHRPGYSSTDPGQDKYFGVNCVKNRMGPLFAVDFSWKGLTGKIGSLSAEDRLRLKHLREENSESGESDESYASRTTPPSFRNRRG